MTINQHGGIFGRNPTFNDVEVSSLGIGSTPPAGVPFEINSSVPRFQLTDADNSAYTQILFNTGSFAVDVDPTQAGDASKFTIDVDNVRRLELNSSGILAVEGEATTKGIVSTKTGSASGSFIGYCHVTGTSSVNNGEILLGTNGSFQGALSYEGQAGGNFYIENTYNHVNAAIVFRSKSSATPEELGRFSSTGLVLPNGKGIDFSATAGTGTSELFDDYEEGSWSPVISDATSGGNTGTATVAYATYTKVGNLVHLKARLLNMNTTGMGSGNIYVQGVPYSADGDGEGIATMSYFTAAANSLGIVPSIDNGASHIKLKEVISGGVYINADSSQFNSGTADLWITITYHT